jgi:hypothetical protein
MDDDGNFNIAADIKIDPTAIKSKRTKPTGKMPADKKDTTGKNKSKLDEQERPAFNPAGNGNFGSMKKISVFVRGQELHLTVPDQMTQVDWDAIIKQIQNIKAFSK